jgi:hypothetical protein
VKRIFVLLVACFLTLGMTGHAIAWEFFLKGEFENRYRYISRTGPGDLFGNSQAVQIAKTLDPTRAVNLGLAGPMGSAVIVEGYSAKGSDAAMGELRMDLFPEIRINQAIRFRGLYSVTQTNINLWGNNNNTAIGTGIAGLAASPPHYAGWHFLGSRGTDDFQGFSTGMWRQAWVTCQTPWGIIVAGKREAPFGPGFSTMHGKESSVDSVALVVPYGPLTFGVAVFQHESGENVGGGYASQSPSTFTGSYPYLLANDSAGDPAAFRGPSPVDQNEVRSVNTSLFLTYKAGSLDIGAIWRYVRHDSIHGAFFPRTPYSSVPNGNFDDATTAYSIAVGLGPASYHSIGNGTPIYGLTDCSLIVTYLDYTNGRFFTNLEYDVEYINTQRNGGRPVSGIPTRWFAEAGWMVGPAKISAAAFYSSGIDRRGGVYDIDRPTGTTNPYVAGSASVPFIPVSTYDQFGNFLVFGGGNETIQPYEFLLGMYGGGNNEYSPSGYWRARDLLAYAARLDYAVAANLNVFGTFMYAERASNTSTYIGQYRGGVSNNPANTKGGTRINPSLNTSGLQTVPIPNVPDNGLGWEANIGLNWKLLESLTFNAMYGYWRPGSWFSWAYTDFGSNATATVDGVAYPVNPNRNIDAIHGFQGSLLVEF